MDFLPVFIKMMELFLIIIFGYIANKCNVLKKDAKQTLTKIVLNISLPCTIISAVMTSQSIPDFKNLIILLIVAFLGYAVFYVLAKITSKVLRLEGKQKGVVEFAIIFSNVGFVGYPVTQAIFGDASVFYTTVFNIPFNVICYSLGVNILNADANAGKTLSIYEKYIKSMITPAMICSVISLIMAVFKFQGPHFLANAFSCVGAITTPAALLIIGSTLADMDVLTMISNPKAYIVTAVSIALTPFLIYLIFAPFCKSDPLLLGEAVVIAGMPVATSGTMLCVQYGGDEKLMAQLTFISTLLSLVSIPIIAILI